MDDYSVPILPGDAASDYERYLRTDELLALQKTPEQMSHRDELLFQTVHQSSELWLKLACFEVEEATARIGRHEVAGASALLRRAADCMDSITRQLHMLDHMSPWDYHVIRRGLGHGAGFDSPGFRQVHHVSPPLGEAFKGLVEEHGLDLVALYQRGRDFPELLDLAERLTDWDERVLLWKFHHFQLVQRVIGGHVIGTQGTPVEVLGKRLIHMYPFLWEARDTLTELASQPETPPSPTPGHGR
jgi:tryptophan 2,3-dioxygenase